MSLCLCASMLHVTIMFSFIQRTLFLPGPEYDSVCPIFSLCLLFLFYAISVSRCVSLPNLQLLSVTVLSVPAGFVYFSIFPILRLLVCFGFVVSSPLSLSAGDVVGSLASASTCHPSPSPARLFNHRQSSWYQL